MSYSAFGVDHGYISKGGMGLKEAYRFGRARNAVDQTRKTAKAAYDDKDTAKLVRASAKDQGKIMDKGAKELDWKQRAAYSVGRNRDLYALGAGGTAVAGGGAAAAAGSRRNDYDY